MMKIGGKSSVRFFFEFLKAISIKRTMISFKNWLKNLGFVDLREDFYSL